MPQIFKVGNYIIYFWSNENDPLEPIHVHVSEGVPQENSTKIWITQTGKCLLCNNNSRIPKRKLRDIMEIIEARSQEIIQRWTAYFKEIRYYC
ncbi:putative uncharacterized protein [Blautia hydrogenotrophica CAG:147]|uniref:DUF4160 domain-containing protein n=1 Tax=Blautia hydrogenotrophica TaxID=53443 RepID=UPI000334BFD6|nr:DUF4160 domain-containing protein [Blautia hydrogenotrophica]CCX58758.1 putative uncharacterized protein [Blautia hydrogenotrophica CAG:147]